MFSRHAKSSASKAALAHVVLRYMERGFRIADVQVKHEKRHPAVKLGEVTRSIRTYVKLVQRLTQAEEVNQ
jgi:Leu/Phe-tRNA-protein transferase